MKELKNDIVIIDYKLGNLFSVKHACEKVGLNPKISSEKSDVLSAHAIIFPGVGSFGNAMENLRKLDLINPIKEKIEMGVQFFGICLGMQLLFEESEEFGSFKGLGIIKGNVKKLPRTINERKIKIPYIGWNEIYYKDDKKWDISPLNSLSQNSYMYFIHSFYVQPENINEILSVSNYEGFEYCSSIKKGNVCAFQFHPEKSGINGIQVYNNIKSQIK